MKHKTEIYFLLGAFLLLNACAISNPVSETVMFKEPIDPIDRIVVIGRPTSGQIFRPIIFRRGGGYISFTTLRRDFKKEEQEIRDIYPNRNAFRDSTINFNERIFNPYGITFGRSRAPYRFGKNGAWSIGIGWPYYSIDATIPIRNNLYGTLNLGFLSGEVILQQKIIDRRRLGISVGPYYHLERRLYIDNLSTELFSLTPIGGILPEPILYNHHVGIRSVFFIPVDSSNEGYGVIKFSYIQNIDIWAIGVGFTFGLGVR